METEFITKCNLCKSKNIEMFDEEVGLYRCADCRYIFDNPCPTLKEIINYYSKSSKYDGWLSNLSSRKLLWQRRVKKMRKNIKKGTLLDVGCGIGQFLDIAKPYYTEVFGTEVSDSAVKIAKEKYNLDIFHGTLDDINFNGKKFDNISMFHLLEHVNDVNGTILNVHKLLIPGGILTIAVPNDIYSLKAIVKKIIGKPYLKKIKLDGSVDEIHLSHFTPQVLKDFLIKKGFEIIELGPDPYFANEGLKLLRLQIYYFICNIINKTLGINVFDTIWVVAIKK
ncbi:hypothetical protein CO058_04040 [candidate division WWE3 bacterium CG_4_9_14_0_2_um_filter_35_11]|uniref:Class I SAM-dependent methyltransferase n=1 Tax=candidate division WWE3 bacterium CG_4_9_14_0_2_um_filter_35_11 TaxID=1975077 RepID=A0A2M8EKN0_UNCKA|nr:MAG: hypothetical protein COV25_03525 [candidate division WWE3 bacterium CG10_big_fil_rev_8_21_14_0_10_35_32]PJC23306.1 MAG: hypothetical protein CO058_04040 [candidate division WWE3 bacterium CG_4_9_14_0_2_um_filter_35_11]